MVVYPGSFGYLDSRGAEEAPTESTARQVKASRAFSFPLAMRSYALPSSQYGNPEDVYAANQAREKRQAQQDRKRPTLTLRSRKTDGEWSEARKAAEALFDIPPRLGRS
jgi:hypothetical protein